MFVARCPFLVGTALKIWSHRYGVYHHGIVSDCLWDGTQLIIHSTKGEGIHVTTLLEFAEGQLAIPTWIPQSPAQQAAARDRAYSQIGRPYHLFGANCEQFVNWVVRGIPTSQQLNDILAFTLILSCAAAVAVLGNQRRG